MTTAVYIILQAELPFSVPLTFVEETSGGREWVYICRLWEICLHPGRDPEMRHRLSYPCTPEPQSNAGKVPMTSKRIT